MTDRLDCQARSRCLSCHHWSDSLGCTLLVALDDALAKPRYAAAEDGSAPTLASFAKA